jgi:hypothetical protein
VAKEIKTTLLRAIYERVCKLLCHLLSTNKIHMKYMIAGKHEELIVQCRSGDETYLCSGHKLSYKRCSALLDGIKNECERAGAVPQIEQLLQQQEAVIPTMGLCRGRHAGLTVSIL